MWTEDEDENLRDAVERLGPKKSKVDRQIQIILKTYSI